MTSFALLAAADDGLVASLAKTAQNTGEQFGVNGSLLLSQVISFLLVAFLLRMLAYKPVLAVLAERRKLIAQGLENAEKIKQELAKAEASRRETMSQANAQAMKLIEEARAAAAKVQEVETQKAIAAAEQIISKAREAAAADHALMLAELKREIGQLVVRTTIQATGKVLTIEDQKRLADETNRQLAA